VREGDVPAVAAVTLIGGVDTANVGSVNVREITDKLVGFGCGFVRVIVGGKVAVHILKPVHAGAILPSEYVAVIANVYFVPGVRPVIVRGLVVPVAAVEGMAVPPRGASAVYVYPVIVLVSHASGGVNAIDTPDPARLLVTPVIVATGTLDILRI